MGGDHQRRRLHCEKGAVDNPKLTLMADALDYVGVFTGKVNPMAAFGEGKIKLKGDLRPGDEVDELLQDELSRDP